MQTTALRQQTRVHLVPAHVDQRPAAGAAEPRPLDAIRIPAIDLVPSRRAHSAVRCPAAEAAPRRSWRCRSASQVLVDQRAYCRVIPEEVGHKLIHLGLGAYR